MTMGKSNAWLAAAALASGLALVLPGCSKARLDLDPAVVSGCQPPRPGHIIRVTWDASRATTGHVALKLARPGEIQPRAWRTGPAVGSALTGPWGSDGLTVLLFAKGKELARRTLVTSPCPQPRRQAGGRTP